MSADLRTVRGTLRAEDCACSFVDPLAALEVPEDDRTIGRTFPGKVDRGSMTIEVAPDGSLRFVARLPRRFGEVGTLQGWGLRAMGGWYPQPVDGGGAPVAGDWTVEVRYEGEPVPVVLNDVVGDGGAAWRGETDRVALAVLPRGVRRDLAVAGGTVTLVEHRRGERALRRWMERAFEGWTLPAPRLVVVEGLDLRRLVHAGRGVLFLSDRAFRLTPPLARFHLAALREGLLAASIPRGDGWERAFAAQVLKDELPAPSVRKLLGWLSWNPVVDALLNDGTLPYYSEVFDEPHAEPVSLVDTFGGRVPARAAAGQVEALQGRPAALLAAQALAEGRGDALAGVSPELREGWARPYQAGQNYRVERRPDGVVLVRQAVAAAPPEVVEVQVDDARLPPWLVGAGPAQLALGDVRRVRVDPGGLVAEADRVDNAWPPRWTVLLSGGIYDISPTQHNFEVDGLLALRRQGDTRNLYLAGLSHDAQDLVSLWFQYVRYVGPLLDRQLRQHRLSFSAGPSLLDPAFRPTEAGAVAVGGGVAYTWDTRQGDEARSGHRLSIGGGGGFIPGSTEAWASASLGGVVLAPVTPWTVLATRARVGWASGEVEHRLLALGGADNLRSVVDHEVVGNLRGVTNVELRQVIFRNASLPIPFAWLSELQLAPGVEAGAVYRGPPEDPRQQAYYAVGGTLGVHVILDGLGARPTLLGVSIAYPLATVGLQPATPQLYFDFTQSF